MLFILLTLVGTILFVWIKWKHTYWNRYGVPCPEPSFLFGNIGPSFLMQEHIGMQCTAWYNEFKDVPYVGYYKFQTPAVLIRDPDLVKDVFIKDHFSFHKNDFHINDKDDPLLSTNPFFSHDEPWKRGRTMLMPLFTASKIKQIYPLIDTTCCKITEYLMKQPTDKEFDAKSLSAKFTTENVIKCMFSLDADCFAPGRNEFRQIGKKLLSPSFSAAIKFLLKPLLPKCIASIVPIPMLSPEMHNFFVKIVQQNKKSREGVQLPYEDFLQMLLNIGQKLNSNDVELAGHALGIFYDGFETSSTILAFSLYEVARNPDIQERAYDEIQKISAKHGNQFTYEALEEMTYLDCVLHESMRFHPAVMHMGKICTKEYTLPKFGNQKEAVTIQPGTSILIPVRGLHYDPTFYPEPEVFKPERFTEEERKLRHRALYLPFGEGPRLCVGSRFGEIQIKAALATIIRDFKVKVSPNHKPIKVDPRCILYQAKDGILLNFERRKTE